MITPEAATYGQKLYEAALAGKTIGKDEFKLLRLLFKIGPAVWQWLQPWDQPGARMIMGVQKNPDGTAFLPLHPGDPPHWCKYCETRVTIYPHSHSKADYDDYWGKHE